MLIITSFLRLKSELTFSMSFSVAGDTSECRRSSGDRGGASPDPSDPFPDPAFPEFRPIFTSECRRCSVSAMGTSNKLSVEFCVSTGCNIDVLCCLRRQILQHQVFYIIYNRKTISKPLAKHQSAYCNYLGQTHDLHSIIKSAFLKRI